MCQKCFCGPYTNKTYGIYPPAVLRNVMEIVTVGCSCFFKSINRFYWTKTSFKIIYQDFFCWFLTFVFLIDRIGVFLFWKLSLGVLEKFLWAVSKLYTHFFSPTGLRKVGVRVLVVWFQFSSLIYWMSERQSSQFLPVIFVWICSVSWIIETFLKIVPC